MAGMKRDEILANPTAANEAVKEITEAAAKSPLPVADLPPADLVTLPGGLMYKGKLIRSAIVRELNGEHEEALARAIQSKNPYHFLDTLMTSGTVRLGDLDDAETRKMLPELLIGDRDEIVLGIRTATYGDVVEVFGWSCPACGAPLDKLSFSLEEDIDRKNMADPAGESVFEVKLRNGRAKVRLITAGVLASAHDMPNLTVPQQNDIILSKTIETWTDKHGQTHLIPGFPSMVRQMSSPDRQKILRELSDRQPGPRYTEIGFKHDGCGEEVTLALGITDLFRDLLVGIV